MNMPQSEAAAEAPVESPFAPETRFGGGNHRLLLGIFLILLVTALYLARDIALPVAIAFLLAIVLSPLVRILRGWGIPEAISAIALVGGVIFAIAIGGYFLSSPVRSWIEDAPRISREIQDKLVVFRGPAETIAEASQTVEAIAAGGAAGEGVQRVELSDSGILGRVFEGVPASLAKIALTMILVVFILASGDLFYEKLVRVMPTMSDKKRAVRIFREVEFEVSRYFLTVAMINTGFGLAVGTGLALVGWATPVVWGLAAALLNFIPYVGGLVAVVIMALVGIVAFDSVGFALLGPAIYIACNVIESNFVTPLIVGRRLELNPVVIVLAVTFWGWLWGIAGLLVAVPFLVVVKVFADHVEGMAPVGEFLAARHSSNGNGDQPVPPTVSPSTSSVG
ncbi:MAG: AI-2E family transporter [Bauldia sp.]|nr:AI-2E family transporter [Bauldia sp.]